MSSEWRDEWGRPMAMVAAIAAGETTARLNSRQRIAMRILLDQVERVHERRRRVAAELERTIGELRQARRDLRDLARNRRCGKVPLRDRAEADRFIALVCDKVGEGRSAWDAYPCDQCTPWEPDAPVWHGGHATPRAARPHSVTGMTHSLGDALGHFIVVGDGDEPGCVIAVGAVSRGDDDQDGSEG